MNEITVTAADRALAEEWADDVETSSYMESCQVSAGEREEIAGLLRDHRAPFVIALIDLLESIGTGYQAAACDKARKLLFPNE